MIDIILPTIGRESLNSAVESVINQTYTNWHLWIICDGYSPTDLWWYTQGIDGDKIDIIEAGPRHNDNGTFARNFGIDQGKAKWICYLDDDDVYLPWHLETMQELFIKDPQAKMMRTAGQSFTWHHKSPRSSKLVRKLGAVNSTDILTPGICHSRELFYKTVGWQNKDNHDLQLWLDMMVNGNSVYSTTDRVTFEFER